MQHIANFEIHIHPNQQGSYFTVPFEVPDDFEWEALTLRYDYSRHAAEQTFIENGEWIDHSDRNIIDLGLIGPDDNQVGASGSDKSEITVSEEYATPGYRPCRILPGEWQVLVGAYKVEPGGVTVYYEVSLEGKSRRLLKGDLHAHTLASDGVHTLEELAFKAKRNGLDFIAVTDHNQLVAKTELPRLPGVTMIPGVEWTHFKGHANFLGVDQPYDGSFMANTAAEIQAKFTSAHQRGALITINHPFEPIAPFQFDLTALPFDCLEVWNGPMRESNLRAVGYWQQLLVSGKKIPACGGSDYHRDTPFIFLGGPTMGVYAESAGSSDILAAIRAGHSYITFAPNGLSIEVSAGEAILGDSVPWTEVKSIQINGLGLVSGDVLRVVTGAASDVLFTMPADGDIDLTYQMTAPGFARVEILRAFLPGLPMLPALISNPIYFDA
ncbi:MAG TPA: CehA/McbA family metallohydrolase [Bellilinea sp.]|nr:CehA/McbA family metallohydrolase [Bellilinea sp.]